MFENFPDCLETFQIDCKLSQFSGKFTDYLESLQVVCKLYKCYVHFPYILESSLSVLKFSTLCGNFPECLENFQIVQTVPLFSRKFLHCVGCFCIIWKVSRPSGKLRELRDNQKSVVNMDCFQELFKLVLCLLKLFGLCWSLVKFTSEFHWKDFKRVSVV